MTTDIGKAVRPADTGALVGLLPRLPRVLALGEPTHGEEHLLELRNGLFRRLVEEHGYRTIALETDCLAGLAVDAHVTDGTGVLDEVVERGLSHGWGSSAANRELVRWMRAHNEGRPAAERVRFAGFDGPLEITAAQSPRAALTALHALLADRIGTGPLPRTAAELDRLLGDDGRWTEPAAMRDPSRSAGRSPEALELRVVADELSELVEERAPLLAAGGGPGELERARLYARTALGLLRYHHAMADASPARMERIVAVRARMMAANLAAAAERGPVLAHAHNAHLQRGPSGMVMGGAPLTWWSAGALLDGVLGEEYACVATALGTLPHQGVDAPPPDTLEGVLYALPDAAGLVDARALAAVLGDPPPAPRTSPWFGYAPLDPARLDACEALLFVRDCPRTPPAGA
ncbi:erythromycin esterase family protein [Streptomyces termitum]|uniref:erythromycin esterase family protein n=1 Tax=Streptomyces termitum TaxID=67368 RepID=UPI0033B97B5D